MSKLLFQIPRQLNLLVPIKIWPPIQASPGHERKFQVIYSSLNCKKSITLPTPYAKLLICGQCHQLMTELLPERQR
eukprot:scaffold525386_cov36-Prasinocladus_malaysianus.AAC.1